MQGGKGRERTEK
uniref:Uncharacterized protein n=1 Tax=Lepeophtheirus salmonis TaxID=72036 RepID=A0A0K2VAP9_LEPSM